MTQLPPSAGADQPLRVAVISLQPIERVSRLRRFYAALRAAGFEAWLIAGCLPDASQTDLEDNARNVILAPSLGGPSARWLNRCYRVLRGASAHLPGKSWRFLEAWDPALRNVETQLRNRQSEIGGLDVVIGHGLSAMPLAEQISAAKGASLVYDVVELFTEQYAYSRTWQIVERPFIVKQERHYARYADALISPSAGYLEQVVRSYRVRDDTPAVVVRNTMEAVADQASTVVDETSLVTLIYQGLALSNRGISIYLESATHWPDRARLVLQLVGAERDISIIRNEIEARGLATKVQIIPPVEATAKALIGSIQSASAAIGLCCFDPRQLQVGLSDPNKLHTYLAAGLAVIGVAGTEVGDIVGRERLGTVIPSFTPEALATGVMGLAANPMTLRQCATRSLARAKDWQWSREQGSLVDLVKSLARRGDRRPGP